MDNASGAKKIAKNTLLLYVRMAVLLLVGLYTSRVVLAVLGETDYGIYNVVGGVVAMFGIISGALSSAVSRFMTFELGRGGARLNAVFRCAVLVQLALSAVVIAVGEPAGLWFIGEKMTIPPDRIAAARIVLQFSLLTFVVNLLCIPYNAAIVAHEKMGAFAAAGLFEGFAKLGVALLLAVSPIDSLVWYALLMCVVALCVRVFYAAYCRRHFPECRRKSSVSGGCGAADRAADRDIDWGKARGIDRGILREMFSFAGWNFIGVSAGVLKDYGGNILINLYSPSPAVNAGRGIAMQLSGAVQGFVTNFMTAVNPQITKSYASGEHGYMHALVRKSAKFSFFLILVFALPLIFETDFLLGLWLKDVPPYATAFARLLLVLILSDSLSNPLITLQLATGNIRRYQIIVGGILLLNIPVSWLLLSLGFGVEWVVAVAIVLSQVSMFARLFLLRGMTGMDVGLWLKEVWLRALAVTACACVPTALPGVFGWEIHPLLTIAIAVCATLFAAWFAGCTAEERRGILSAARKRLGGCFNRCFNRRFNGRFGRWFDRRFGKRFSRRDDPLSRFRTLPRKVYAATNRSVETLSESSSGGVFSALARAFVRDGGVVCAAVWDDDFMGVRHSFAYDEDGLKPMMRSKYVQSSLGGCFLKIRDMLTGGKRVMFVGTPCQVAALRRFIPDGVMAEQLLLVEILCHGAPLSSAWKSYTEELLKSCEAQSIGGVNFRDKSAGGWKDYRVTVSLNMPDGSVKTLSRPYMQVPFMRDFLSGTNLREACRNCTSRCGRSGADLSLGDFWGVDKLMPQVFDPMGVSVVSVFSDRGAEALAGISPSLKLKEVPMDVFERSIAHNGGYGSAASKIAVITLQMHTNYGGVLQAFALQRALESMGNEVEIIQSDRILPEPKGMAAVRKLLTRSFRKYVQRRSDVEIFRERRINREYATVGAEFLEFFSKYLKIRHISSFAEIRPSDYAAFVVGSDQVWRPKYNPELMHSFLDFTWGDSGRTGCDFGRNGRGSVAERRNKGGWNVRRIAYAVSFGCDGWEYNERQTALAAELAGRFDALSFRELSGVKNASEHLGLQAVTVLDPTLLLDAEEYLGLLSPGSGFQAPSESSSKERADAPEYSGIFEYVLDRNTETEALVAALEAALEERFETVTRFLPADPRGRGEISRRVQPSVESWIAGIAGAGLVLTDSFHACVFSILFHKPFAVVGNRSRGISRITWLLEQFGLENRLLTGPSLPEGEIAWDIPEGDIDWDAVDARLKQLRAESVKFLKKSLKR